VPNGEGEAALAGGLSVADLGMGVFAVSTALLAAMLALSLLRQRQRAMVRV